MKSDIVVIGGGASGLMAAYSAASSLVKAGKAAQVTVLEKMPRPARKVMITGKGRCNFTNVKEWNDFSSHVRSGVSFVKSSFYNLPPSAVVRFFEDMGMKTVVERGDRAFPVSYHASDVVDALVNACHGAGVKIECEAVVEEVKSIGNGFEVLLQDGSKYLCSKVIIATGGLSYPTTGSTGDGFAWASALGHHIVPTFPSLTALVPKGYKIKETEDIRQSRADADDRFHIDRSTPLSELGEKLCGIQMKNVGLSLYVQDNLVDTDQGDVDFTDGGIEGPLGFRMSRKAVKSIVNGSKVSLVMDLKPGVTLTEITERVKTLWKEVDKDPRSARLREKEKCRILLGKLMPWDLIPAFVEMHREIYTLERRSRTETKLWINLVSIAKALKVWRFDIAGYVGYERAVVTAGGVSTDDVVAKTMESRLVSGLYFCGEVLDVDSDTGGYNLQTAFCTGALAGLNAAKSLK